MNETIQSKRFSSLINVLIVAVALGSLFLVAKIVTEVKKADDLGNNGQNILYVSGKGEAVAIPDVAQISFDVSETAADVAAAQKQVTARMNDIIASLKAQNIEEKDIKTGYYNIYPKYDYVPVSCGYGSYCPGNQKLSGYTVTHGVTVIIRKTDEAGNVLSSLGQKKVTNVSGISFTIENEEKVRAEARSKAIADAKEKAKAIAKDLDVDLDNIINFSENNYPVYYGRGGGIAMDASVKNEAAPMAPTLPAGENKITVEVTLSYEIDR